MLCLKRTYWTYSCCCLLLFLMLFVCRGGEQKASCCCHILCFPTRSLSLVDRRLPLRLTGHGRIRTDSDWDQGHDDPGVHVDGPRNALPVLRLSYKFFWLPVVFRFWFGYALLILCHNKKAKKFSCCWLLLLKA